MEFLILVLVVVGFYKMNQKSNEYKETADKAQSQLNAYVKANQTAESIIKNAAQLSSNKLEQAEQQAKAIIEQANSQSTEILNEANDSLYILQQQIQEREQIRNSIPDLTEQANALEAKIERSKKKVKEVNLLCKNALAAIDSKFRDALPRNNIEVIEDLVSDLEQILPNVSLDFHALEYPDLRKEYRQNEKLIKEITDNYVARYTLKTYAAIYKLMVLALNAELQNIMYNLKFGNLEEAKSDVEKMLNKYVSIATEGNKTIAPTILAFITEIRGHFMRAVEIEYMYYVKREKAREEQAALKEQMRQEAAERKALEEQRAQVVKEENKYKSEINNIQEQLNVSQDDEQIELFKKRIAELEQQLSSVEAKKEEITNLQNGKAGYIYIISNLGSFGDKMFKIGMTRRIDPQDRVNELGDASVPFKFDVHSFIFSEDAVALESALHQRLNEQRVNKINTRKEFFYCTIDELENLVLEIEPTAPFTRTMLAEQYRQSQEMAAQSK